jgi:predicted NAD/FAD-binding protein
MQYPLPAGIRPLEIAVIGAGIAGLMSARLLSRRHRVTLIEASNRLGGHANTCDIRLGNSNVPVDTGFIVYNEVNYPLLTRLFRDLGVRTEPSNMSFSVSLAGGQLEYGGNARGIFAQPKNLIRPAFWRMLRDIPRFNRAARAFSSPVARTREQTVRNFLDEGRYSEAFRNFYLLPMAAAIWSSTSSAIEQFPMQSLAQFFANHGLLQMRGRPCWRTVTGGSRAYVRLLAESMNVQVTLDSPVARLKRFADGIDICDARGHSKKFDHVVLATHADEALDVLGPDATPQEISVLRGFRYQANRIVLHGDPRLMPRRRQAWAAWNYASDRLSPGRSEAGLTVTYWMNRLQTLPTDSQVFVSLNPILEPSAGLVHGEFHYAHPQFDLGALRAKQNIGAIQGMNRVSFCGAYLGDGFHEDAVRSSYAVAASLGVGTGHEPELPDFGAGKHRIRTFGTQAA